MILFVDLRAAYGSDDTSEAWPFALLDASSDHFMEFLGEQVFHDAEDLRRCLVVDDAGARGLVALVPSWWKTARR